MRIPTLDGPRLQQTAAPTYQPMQIQGDTSIGQGLQGLAQGLGAVGQAVGAEVNEQRRANSLLVTDARTQYEREITRYMQGDSEDRTLGFLSSKGDEAWEQSSKTLENLSKAREAILNKLEVPELRDEFSRQSAQMYEGVRRQVQHHVAAQFEVARKSSASALQEETLRNVATMTDETAIAARTKDVEVLLRAGAPTREQADAEVMKWRQDVITTRIAADLISDNIGLAEQKMQANAETLGDRLPKIKAAIDAAKRADTTQTQEAQNERDAAAILEKWRGEDGYVREEYVHRGLEAVEPGRRNAVTSRLNRMLADEAEAKKADIQNWRNEATRNLLDGKPINGGVLEKLRTYDPEWLKRTTDAEDARNRARAEHAKSMGRQSERDGRTELAINDRQAEYDFRALTTEGMANADVDEFVADRFVSEPLKAKLKMLKAQSSERINKGVATAADRFVNSADAAFSRFRTSSKENKKFTEEDRADFRAQAAEEWDAFYVDKGRAPTAEEAQTILSKLTATKIVTSPGVFFDSQKKVPAFKAPGAAASSELPTTLMEFDTPNGVRRVQVSNDKVDAAKRKGGRVVP